MIIHGDSHDADPALLALIDTQITDWPYSEHVHANAMSSHTLASGGPRDRDLGYACITPEDRALSAIIAASIPRWTIIFCDLESTHLWRDAMAAAGVEYIRQQDWIRWSQAQISGDRPCNGTEAVLHFHSQIRGARGGLKPRAKSWNGDGGRTHYDQRGIRGDDKRQGQKPIDLALELVCSFSDPGECVGDLATGAGTFPLAARLLGREAVGWELDAYWAKFAADRELAYPCARDLERIREWCDLTEERARAVVKPRPPATDKCWHRAQRRIADVARVRKAIVR